MSGKVFYSAVCHVCKTYSEDLKTCSSCRLILYCSLDHQKLDWPAHRSLCLAVKKIVTSENLENIFADRFNYFSDMPMYWIKQRSLAMARVEGELERLLNPVEKQMFWFPAVCSVCHSFRIIRSLTCNKCHCSFYCCTDHRDDHKAVHDSVCSQFALCFKLDKLMNIDNYSHPEIKMNHFKDDIFVLPNNINDFIEAFIEFPSIKYFPELASDLLTCTTTVIYSIVKEHILAEVGTRISIVIVGAEMLGPERGFVECLEVFLHFFYCLTEVEIQFVGPEVSSCPLTPLCSTCSEKTLKVSFHNKLYHEFISSDVSHKPDAIFIFHCGFHETASLSSDPWEKSIPLLYKSKFLTVFTSYTEMEATEDFTRFIQLKPPSKTVSLSAVGVLNPFRSLRPIRDVDTESIFFQNNFITIINTSEGATKMAQ